MDTPTNTAAILETYERLLYHTLTLLWERAYYKNDVPHVNIITAELENVSGLTLQDGNMILLQPLMEIGYLAYKGVTWDDNETKMEVFTLNTLENTEWEIQDTIRSLESAVVRPSKS